MTEPYKVSVNLNLLYYFLKKSMPIEEKELKEILKSFLKQINYIDHLISIINYYDNDVVFIYKILKLTKEIKKLNSLFFSSLLLKCSLGFLEQLKVKYQLKKFNYNQLFHISGKDFGNLVELKKKLKRYRYNKQLSGHLYLFFTPIQIQSNFRSRLYEEGKESMKFFLSDFENLTGKREIEMMNLKKDFKKKEMVQQHFREKKKFMKELVVKKKFWEASLKGKITIIIKVIYQNSTMVLRTPGSARLSMKERIIARVSLYTFFFFDLVKKYFFNIFKILTFFYIQVTRFHKNKLTSSFFLLTLILPQFLAPLYVIINQILYVIVSLKIKRYLLAEGKSYCSFL